MDSNLAFKKLSQKVVYSNYREILSKEFELPDGSLVEFEISHSKSEAVVIVALDKENRLILSKQFRQGIEKVVAELPAGMSEHDENTADAAKRELLEETGYITDNIIQIGSYHGDSSNDVVYHAFLARKCEKVTDQKLDKTEFIEVVTMSLDDYEKYIRENRLGAGILLSFFLAKPYI